MYMYKKQNLQCMYMYMHYTCTCTCKLVDLTCIIQCTYSRVHLYLDFSDGFPRVFQDQRYTFPPQWRSHPCNKWYQRLLPIACTWYCINETECCTHGKVSLQLPVYYTACIKLFATTMYIHACIRNTIQECMYMYVGNGTWDILHSPHTQIPVNTLYMYIEWIQILFQQHIYSKHTLATVHRIHEHFLTNIYMYCMCVNCIKLLTNTTILERAHMYSKP